MSYADRLAPLRPAPEVVYAHALRSLSRAAIVTARRVREPNLKSLWRDDADADLITRAASAPASTSNTAGLTTVKLAFIAALQPVSAAAEVIGRSLQMDFGGALQISLPTLTAPNAKWVKEGAPIPVAKGVSASGPTINPFKLAVITSFSYEMLVSSNIESMMRQLLVENTAPVLDSAMFSNSAGTAGVQPPGLLNTVSPLTVSAAIPGSAIDVMIADLQKLARALAKRLWSGHAAIDCRT